MASNVDCSSTKKRRKNPDDISVFDIVPDEILRSIFERLDLINIIRAKAVCSSWNLLGEEFVSKTPWLMLPSREEVERGDGTEANLRAYGGFLKLGESEVCSMKKIPKELRESCCIGSSNGWLIFFEEKAVPFLFHPFRQVKIALPSLYGLLGLRRMERTAEGDFEVERFNYSKVRYGKQELRYYFIRKAILAGEPDCNNKKYRVILLFKDGKIAYHKSGGSCWTEVLDTRHVPYQDIICYQNHLFALSGGNNIEVWNCEGDFMSKRLHIVPTFPEKSLSKINSFGDLCAISLYLVESCGDILLVVRFIGEFVDSDGKLVHEGDVLDWVCSYRTCLFHVYKLDFNELKWVEMATLGDRVLFLGGNQSVSVSTRSFPDCEGNLIYYTDDYFQRMEEDYSYGGHDMGVYNLKDGTVKPIYEYSSEQILPPPCWIIPNPKPC
ncbi:hypothetical protein SCA6_015974 [Theobroma cacao]